MTLSRRFFARVRDLFRLSAVDRDDTEAIQSHLDHLTDDYVRQGLDRDEARRRALRDFGGAGGLQAAREAVRDARGLPLVEQTVLDVRRAIRSLNNTRAFTLTAIVTLALGIGVSTAVFTLLDHVVLRPLPYPEADRLVAIWEARIEAETEANPRQLPGQASLVIGRDDPNRLTVAPASYMDFRARAAGFADMAGYARQSVTLSGLGEPETLMGEIVTASYFPVLRGVPAAGRLIQPADELAGAPPVVVISDALWRRRFGGDLKAVGASLMLNSKPHEVIGIMPPDFVPVSHFVLADPISYWTNANFPPELLANYGDHEIHVVARLADGVTIDDGRRNLTAVSEDIARRSPQTNRTMRAFARPLGDDLVRRVRTSLTVMTLMVGFILLIACVNVANLLIVRSAGRRREVAIRFALGASRRRIVSEMLAESLLLAGASCAAGLLLALWIKDALVALAPPSLPRLASVSLDGRVIAISAGAAVVTGLVFGVLPAWQARRARPADAMASGNRVLAGRWMMRWRNALLIFEVAMSTVLLVGAGLMVKSLVALNRVDLGFRTEGVLAMNVSLPEPRYPTGDSRFEFFRQLEARAAAIPGVVSVGYASRIPMRGAWDSGFSIDGPAGPGPMVQAGFQAVSPGFFTTLDIRLIRGRLLAETDVKSAELVAVVSDAFSKRFLDGEDPLGRRFRRGPQMPWITIVGVVTDIRRDGKRAAVDPQVFLSAAQTQAYPTRLADIAVRVQGDDGSVRAALRAAVAALDPNQPVANVRTLEEVVSNSARDQRFQALLVGTFALLALVLATVGVHGVVSYIVAQRTAEIGVRMALGAGAAVILQTLVAATGARVVAGSALGLAVAAMLSKYVESLLFQVPATDTLTYAVATAALVVTAIGAAALAARRATAIDPVRALRAE